MKIITGDFEDIRIFQFDAASIPNYLKKIKTAYDANTRYLEEHPPVTPAAMPITATFICAHAPDYVGLPTVHWQEAEWTELFTKMHNCGVDTAVLQAALWAELGECYYKSAIFKDHYRQWELISPMMAAAKKVGIKLYLGGYGSLSGMNWEMSESAVMEEIELHSRCMLELFERDSDFAGIYYVPETVFEGKREPEQERRLKRIYQRYIGSIARALPGKPVIMSPGSCYCPGKEQEFLDFWQNILGDLSNVIMAPQDSVGCGFTLLKDQHAMWELWRKLADLRKMPLWANIELFARRQCNVAQPFDAAEPERVLSQLQLVAGLVDRCLCWEFAYFTGKATGAEALYNAVFRPFENHKEKK